LAKADAGVPIETLVQLVKSGFFTQKIFTELVSTPRMKELLKEQRAGVVLLREFAGLKDLSGMGKRRNRQYNRYEANH
jgi:hypothetical protein